MSYFRNGDLIVGNPLGAGRKRIHHRHTMHGEGFGDIISTIKKYRPIATIDNLLRDFGVRDAVRNKLSQSKVGRILTNVSDAAISHGFGRRRVVRRKHYGGSKTHRRLGRPRKPGRPKLHGGARRRVIRHRRVPATL